MGPQWFVTQAGQALGARLRSVVLYGSAAAGDFIEGKSLYELVNERGGRLVPSEAVHYIAAVLDVLGAAHAGRTRLCTALVGRGRELRACGFHSGFDARPLREVGRSARRDR